MGRDEIGRAACTFSRWAEWRASLCGDDVAVAKLRASNSCMWSVRDKSRCPVCWLRPMLHHGGSCDLGSIAFHYNELFEEGCKLADDSCSATSFGSFSVVYDRRGLGFW